jgi:hypothetical protein
LSIIKIIGCPALFAKDGAEDLHRKNIYFIDPAGFEVEFVQYLSGIPEERNSTQ